jgi:hypothetical protein
MIPLRFIRRAQQIGFSLEDNSSIQNLSAPVLVMEGHGGSERLTMTLGIILRDSLGDVLRVLLTPSSLSLAVQDRLTQVHYCERSSCSR